MVTPNRTTCCCGRAICPCQIVRTCPEFILSGHIANDIYMIMVTRHKKDMSRVCIVIHSARNNRQLYDKFFIRPSYTLFQTRTNCTNARLSHDGRAMLCEPLTTYKIREIIVQQSQDNRAICWYPRQYICRTTIARQSHDYRRTDL